MALICSSSSASVTLAARGDAVAALVVGGLGDLEQTHSPLDAVTCGLLRLDEGVQLHRVSLAKKTVARLRISTSSLRERFSRRNRVSSSLLLGGQAGAFALVDLGLFHPGAHVGLGQIEVPGHLADAAIAAPAQLDDLSLELRSERATRTRLLPLHGLHFGHPLRGCAPDGGCPSNRRKPSTHRDRLGGFGRCLGLLEIVGLRSHNFPLRTCTPKETDEAGSITCHAGCSSSQRGRA